MKNTEDKIDHLIGKLRLNTPELQDADLLTDQIMKNLKRTSQPNYLIFIRIVSSAAAVFLLGLFLFQQTETEAMSSTSAPTHPIVNKIDIDIDSTCLQNQAKGQITLLETYLCYMQENAQKNNQLKAYTQQFNN
jgi:flagellar basal body-associated protein FliL